MKLGYFITHFPYQSSVGNYLQGGAEHVAYSLAISMTKKHDVYVFTTSADSKDLIESYNGLEIHRYGTKFRIEHGNMAPKLFYDPLKYNVDIIHAHFSTPPAELAALRCAKERKLPFIITYHGDWQENFGRFARRIALSFYNKFLIHRVLSNADVIILPSEYYINESKFLNKYRDKTVVIPNGVNIEEFEVQHSKEECREKLGLPFDKDILLFVGALYPHKAPHILIKAFSRVIEEMPETQLIIMGDGVLRDELKKLSRRLGVSSYVKFVGFINNTFKKALYYNSADVFVLPSFSEVFPLVLLEASAAGLPLVVSNLNTFRCIVEEGYNGLFTKVGDEHDLAEAIVYLLTNENERKKMAKNSKEKVKNYSWDNIAKITEELYRNILNQEL